MTVTSALPPSPQSTPSAPAPLHDGSAGAGWTDDSAAAEFDRQVEAFVAAGYPALAGWGEDAFRALLEPLREPAVAAARGSGPAAQRLPFAIAVTSALVTPDLALPRVHWGRTTGWTEFTAEELATFVPAPGVTVPDEPAYLVTEVDTGAATLGMTVRDAVPRITGEGRTPLTIDEGVSLLVLFPAILKDRNAFFLPGSRCGDKRVTALWVSKGHPRLGWCWEGNPHTWLGSASAADRVSRDAPAAG